MTTAVTGLLQPATPEEEKRRRGFVLGAAATSVLSLVGGIIFLLFSGQTPTPSAPLKPRSTPSTVASAPPATEAPASSGDLLGALGANYADTGGGSAAGLPSGTGGSAPIGGVPLSSLNLPPGQQAPAVDWGEVLAPAAQAQQDAIAANLTGAITGPVIGLASSGINSGAILLGDVILYAAYTNNGGGLLNQLQTAIPAAAAVAAVPAVASAGTAPAVDFSGLSSAFAATSALPGPVGLPALPQLPQLPPLPTPEQVTAALSALPALPALGALQALPPPPNLPGLPTPEEALLGASAGAAAMAALPALLPPPPPIGLPAFPSIGLPAFPPIGLPSIGLPSITRLLGLPF